MVEQIDRLLRLWEGHEIDRRELLGALVMTSLARPRELQLRKPAFGGRILNHVTLNVTNLERSRAFYQGLLGATVQKQLANQADLRIGNSFITVLSGDQPAGIAHFCAGVENFDGDSGLERLRREYADTQPRLLTNELGQKQIILKDPDGITVEIAAANYRL
jgi:catechol 2,3-dioxygenase-like lactoylglutathione lyase family enzyme